MVIGRLVGIAAGVADGLVVVAAGIADAAGDGMAGVVGDGIVGDVGDRAGADTRRLPLSCADFSRIRKATARVVAFSFRHREAKLCGDGRQLRNSLG
jgi:hypothetical protein